jgi:hypothetical protein
MFSFINHGDAFDSDVHHDCDDNIMIIINIVVLGSSINTGRRIRRRTTKDDEQEGDPDGDADGDGMVIVMV